MSTALAMSWAHKRRLVGTTLAVLLGVTFLTATLVLGDTARAGFEVAFEEANAGTDAVVRSSTSLTGGEQRAAVPLDASIVDRARGVAGVSRVAPTVEGFAQIVGADGTPLGGSGPPTLGAAWIGDENLTGWELAEGRAPERAGEVVVDRGSATRGDLAVGSTTTVLAPAPVPVAIVGIATFGGSDSLGGVTLAAFTLDEAQRLLLGGRPQVTGVVVGAHPGVSQDELVARLSTVLPPGVEAITGAQLTAEQRADIESDFLGFFETALLGFAAVALVVAGFSIFNTFSVLGAQRTRESALLRALGASRGQLLCSGLMEAGLVGLAGSAVGVGAGIGVSKGMLSLLDANGFGLPVAGLGVAPASVTAAVAVGMVVTLLGAAVPSWRSSRVAPLAALRAASVDGGHASRPRLAAGIAFLLVGAGLALQGGFGSVAVGAPAVLVAVALLGPAVARPVVALLGAPLAVRGLPGDLARRNAVRNPKRTSATAAALLIGVGVVTLFTLFGASVSASIESAVQRSFGGDLVVESSGFSGAGLSVDLLEEVRALPEVEAAAGLGFGAVKLDGEDHQMGFADLAALGSIATLDVRRGDLSSIRGTEVAISTETAEDEGWALGHRLSVVLPDGASRSMTVAAVYEERAMGGEVLVPEEMWRAHAPQTTYSTVLVGLAEGVHLEDGRRAVAGVTQRHGNPPVRDRDEFVESQAAEVDALLGVIYGLLAVAIVIAMMGIGNTVSLSVHERTRELGLLRAVGQTRAELRSMVRWESVLVATFGTAGGVCVGVFLGWAMVRAISASEGFGTFALPAGPLLTVMLIGAAVGVAASIRPAWRASRVDVLAAVATE
ncbi:MAG TPA: FtsX-like permease family protein [Acidimicrobiales bacterium]|nr:FtsX-like permease family protein [Acidimicrobiales bacterium]